MSAAVRLRDDFDADRLRALEGDYGVFHAHIWKPEMRGNGIASGLSLTLGARV